MRHIKRIKIKIKKKKKIERKRKKKKERKKEREALIPVGLETPNLKLPNHPIEQ